MTAQTIIEGFAALACWLLVGGLTAIAFI